MDKQATSPPEVKTRHNLQTTEQKETFSTDFKGACCIQTSLCLCAKQKLNLYSEGVQQKTY